jgi:tRNA uridine 5-carbamoylmethylation protein Kti12
MLARRLEEDKNNLKHNEAVTRTRGERKACADFNTEAGGSLARQLIHSIVFRFHACDYQKRREMLMATQDQSDVRCYRCYSMPNSLKAEYTTVH